MRGKTPCQGLGRLRALQFYLQSPNPANLQVSPNPTRLQKAGDGRHSD